jgi:hypothetical protein
MTLISFRVALRGWGNGRYLIGFRCPPERRTSVGINALLHPAGGPVPVRVIARRPDAIVGFGETRIHAETVTFELRASEVANPRPGDQLTIGGDSFVIQGQPDRRDLDRLVWTVDVRPT